MTTAELEKTILGEIVFLFDRDKQIDYFSNVSFNEFESNENKVFAQKFAEILFDKKIAVDAVSLFETTHDVRSVISPFLISNIGKDISSAAHLKEHILLLRERQYRNKVTRIIRENAVDIKNTSNHDDLEEIKDKLIADLAGLSLNAESKLFNIPESEKRLWEKINSKKEMEGYSWGIRDLDNVTGGIITPNMTVIGGLKKGGKSRFMIHTASVLESQNVKSAILSLEMPGDKVVRLLKSNQTRINDFRLRPGRKLSDEEKQKFLARELNSDSFLIDDSAGLTFDQTCGRIRRLAKLGAKVIFIDHLQRIKIKSRSDKVAEYEDGCQRIFDTMKENNVHVIAFSQFTKDAEDRAPTIADLKWGGGASEAADTIMMFDNIYRRNKTREGDIDIYFEQRDGESGKISTKADLGICHYADNVDFIDEGDPFE